jgi:biotin transport system substrate-specific component
MTIAMPRMDRLPQAERGITIADFLVPIRIGERISTRARHIALILLGTLLVVAATQVIIPTSPVPFTGQTFAVLLVGGALGFRRAALSLTLYLLLGAIGLPVFSRGGHGTEFLLGATGGYIVGFIVAAAVAGRLAELGWDRHLAGAIGAMLVGNVIIYAFGAPWLAVVSHRTLTDAIAVGVTPFLLWDAIKIVVAAGIFPAAWWLVGRRPGER